MTQLRTIDLPPTAPPSLEDLRTHRESLTGLDTLVARIKHLLTLDGLVRLEVTPEYLQLDRVVRAGAEVAPVEPDEGIDVAGLLTSLEYVEVEDPTHALSAFQSAVSHLADKDLRVVGVVSPSPELLAAFLGLDTPPKTCLGHPVFYVGNPEADRFIVLGGKSSWLDDATTGVIIDPFLMIEKAARNEAQ